MAALGTARRNDDRRKATQKGGNSQVGQFRTGWSSAVLNQKVKSLMAPHGARAK
jgi:hypothetical protein